MSLLHRPNYNSRRDLLLERPAKSDSVIPIRRLHDVRCVEAYTKGLKCAHLTFSGQTTGA